MIDIRNKLVYVFVFAVFSGLLGGIAGELFSRAYLAEKIYKIPMFGELNFNAADYNKSNIVISNPKKVVVEQGERVANVAESSKSGLARIYLKKASAKTSTSTAFSVSDYYSSSDEAGRGYVVTADGWIISRFFPEDKEDGDKESSATATVERLKAKYVIEVGGKLYGIDNFAKDSAGKYSYWRVSARDLPVQAVLGAGSVKNGDQILLINRFEQVWAANIYGKSSDTAKAVRSSDPVFVEAYMNIAPPETFANSFVFNMDGSFMGILNDKKAIVLFENPADIIYNLTKSGRFLSMKLGINYVDLAALAEGDKEKPRAAGAILVRNDKGVAVEKGSAAEKAGLKEGDIIIRVDNSEVNKNETLRNLLSRKKSGEKAEITYLRTGRERTTEVLF